MNSFFAFFTAIPTRSASGSVARTNCAPISFAFSIARFNADGSSGFGDFTVGKFPSIIFCSSTEIILVKPNLFNAFGTRLTPLP